MLILGVLHGKELMFPHMWEQQGAVSITLKKKRSPEFPIHSQIEVSELRFHNSETCCDSLRTIGKQKKAVGPAHLL